MFEASSYDVPPTPLASHHTSSRKGQTLHTFTDHWLQYDLLLVHWKQRCMVGLPRCSVGHDQSFLFVQPLILLHLDYKMCGSIGF